MCVCGGGGGINSHHPSKSRYGNAPVGHELSGRNSICSKTQSALFELVFSEIPLSIIWSMYFHKTAVNLAVSEQ